MMGALARMAEAAGAPPTRLMRDFAALSLGPGRVSLSDYEQLRLYDESFWGEADRRAVVGRRRGREIALQANYRHDCFALATNRLAAGAYLAAHGLPALPVEAIYREGLATPSSHVLRTRDELRRFLEQTAQRTLVGRPVEGGRVRTIAVETPAQLDRLVDEIGEMHAGGYLFQPHLAPHPEVAAVIGRRLAAVRLLTLNSDHGPKVFRAIWKLPGCVAQLDLRTGEVLRVLAEPTGEGVHRRPRSAASLRGVRVPDWELVKAAAVEAARLMDGLAFVGWDVAPSEHGPVILSLTPTPDLVRFQLVERRGVLDAEFAAFLEGQRRLGAEHAEQLKACW